jgi:uncharacterized protein (DUF1684 family)
MLGVLGLAVGLHLPCAEAQEAKTGYAAELDQWRADRAKELKAPEGWLSLVGLEWLREGANTVGSAPGNSLHLPDGGPAHLAVIQQVGKIPGARLKITPASGEFPAGFTIDGKKASPGVLTENSKLKFGSFTVSIITRGDRLGLRIKDLNAPTRTGFHGLKWYAPNFEYRVKAKWIPYAQEHAIAVPTIIGTTLHEKVPGAAEFNVDGRTVRLEPIVEGTNLFFILRDTTSSSTTYGAGRFLYTNLPSGGLGQPGELTLDFNRLMNPPCAYTAFATCPLPPQQNRLLVAIPAGERRYHDE